MATGRRIKSKFRVVIDNSVYYNYDGANNICAPYVALIALAPACMYMSITEACANVSGDLSDIAL